jgi:hypothetical protein
VENVHGVVDRVHGTSPWVHKLFNKREPLAIRSTTTILFNRNGTPGSNLGRPSRDERSTTNIQCGGGSATKKGGGAAWLTGARRLGGSDGFSPMRVSHTRASRHWKLT